MKYLRFLLIAITVGTMSGMQACTDKQDVVPDQIRGLTVICDTVNLLTARIHFEWLGSGDIGLEVEPIEGRQPQSVVIHGRNQEGRVAFDILGLREQTEYLYRIREQAGHGGGTIYEGTFKTPALPDWIRYFLPADPEPINMEGLILINSFEVPPQLSGVPMQGDFPASAFYVIAPDGRLILARTSKSRISAVKYSPRGTFISMHSDYPGTSGSNHIIETSLAGDTLLHLEYGRDEFDRMVHHDFLMTDNHEFILITESEKNGVKVDGLMRLTRSGKKLWEWDTSEIIPVDSEPYIPPWGNSVYLDFDGHLVVSFRNLHQVWKIHKDTRQVIWRLGKNGTIPLHGDDVFLTQHMARFIEPNRIIMFDNGQDLAWHIRVSMDHRPYSRIAWYDFNESQTSISGSRFINLPPKYFSWAMGSVTSVNGHLLVGASWPGYLLYLDPNGSITNEWKFGTIFYRAVPIPDFLNQ